MLSISHALTGAFIASQLPHPALYGPLALGSHYLADWIPHWDFGTGLSSGKRAKSTALILEFGELVVTFVVLYWLFQAGENQIQWHIWLGALIGISPDLVDAPANFLKTKLAILQPFTDFHHIFHHSTPHILYGLVPQIIVIGAILLLL